MSDILAKESVTLEELLDEDELLQEIKGVNTSLLDLCVASAAGPCSRAG